MVGGFMGIRLSGGIGPVRVSVPVLGGGSANAAVGLFGLMVKGFVYLVWFELVLCWYLLAGCYWVLRGRVLGGPAGGLAVVAATAGGTFE